MIFKDKSNLRGDFRYFRSSYQKHEQETISEQTVLRVAKRLESKL